MCVVNLIALRKISSNLLCEKTRKILDCLGSVKLTRVAFLHQRWFRWLLGSICNVLKKKVKLFAMMLLVPICFLMLEKTQYVALNLKESFFTCPRK
jgi:hypothetical protein